MKLTIVGQDFAGGQGVDFATAITARMFAMAGWAVDVLVSQVHADYLREGKKAFELPSAVNLIYMPSRRGSRNAWFVRKYLRTCGADFVIAESGIYAWCIRWASFGIPKRRLPKLVQVNHGVTEILKGWALFKARIKYWFLYGKYYALFFVNAKSSDNFQRMFWFSRKLRMITVNNACMDSVFLEKIKKSPTHPWLVRKTCKTFVAAGAYHPVKNHMVILRTMKIIKEKGIKARVVIFGRGELESAYRKYIVDNDLDDFVSVGTFSNVLPAEIKAADGFLLSSNRESFGIGLVEGLGCRVPCIATDAPFGPREILADGKYGRLVPVNNPKAMAEAMLDCIAEKIAVAPDEAWERYTIEKTMHKYLQGMGLE